MPFSTLDNGEAADLRKRVSVVVVTRNRQEQFFHCVESLGRYARGVELVVVDDHSRPPYVDAVVPVGTRVVRNSWRKYLNPSRNIGAALATREFLFFIDDDNIVQKETIPRLVQTLNSRRDVGVATPVALTPDGMIWYAGGHMSALSGMSVFPLKGLPRDLLPRGLTETRLFHNCFMMSSALFRLIRGFDGEHFPMYLAEADAAERLFRLGLKVVVNPAAMVVHEIEGRGLSGLMRNIHITDSARAYFVGRNRILFMRMHRGHLRFTLFLLLFQPVISAVHILSIISSRKKTQRSTYFIGPYLRGMVDGISGRVRLGYQYAKPS